MTRRYTRRTLLGGAGAAGAALIVGCGEDGTRPSVPLAPGALELEPSTTARPAPTVLRTATPRPRGAETRTLMAGTAWETPVSIRASGLPGATLVVLGGVHGNEPGGWLAADEIANWEPASGVLAVVPRANQRAIAGFLRLVDGEGDLNRSYPGDAASEVAMSRMAAEIRGVAAELEATLLLDLHESWAFYADREAAGIGGTAFLGQTITGGAGPLVSIAAGLGDAVNPGLSERERFFVRDGSSFRRDDSSPQASSRGRSSLSLGGHVPGLTPVLVETAQQDLAVERRAEMHLLVVREAVGLMGMG